ncbi:hypothetical protein [Bacillus subtilis]|uniref:hypothetical protein n=1 Tax=Bacillus subtilis TaxID=1423 RepID=UPI003F744EF8
MYDKNPEKIYLYHLGIFWLILRKEVTSSFITTIYPDEDMSVGTKELDTNILNWLSKGFINIVERTEKILRNSAFFSIGFEIFNLTSELRKIEKESLSKNDSVSIEYQSITNYLEAKLNLMIQDFGTLDGRLNLKKFDFKEKHVSKPMLVRTTKLIDSFDIFLKQNLPSNEQMIIPNLLAEQSFLIQKERHDSYTQLAKNLIGLQEKYLQVIDLNEVSNLI